MDTATGVTTPKPRAFSWKRYLFLLASELFGAYLRERTGGNVRVIDNDKVEQSLGESPLERSDRGRNEREQN